MGWAASRCPSDVLGARRLPVYSERMGVVGLRLLILLACSAWATGCSCSNAGCTEQVRAEGPLGPEAPATEDVELDVTKCHNESCQQARLHGSAAGGYAKTTSGNLTADISLRPSGTAWLLSVGFPMQNAEIAEPARYTVVATREPDGLRLIDTTFIAGSYDESDIDNGDASCDEQCTGLSFALE
jgi:hypothetical protein